MIFIQSLEKITIDNLLDVFNQSFSDYIIPFKLTKEQLEIKIESEGIRLDLSFGAFDNNQLIAFILHGFKTLNNVTVLYNAGTGVIPEQRGQQLTIKLYQFAKSHFINQNFDKIILEVIATNKPAIQSYLKIGFINSRKLNCYRGIPEIHSNSTNNYLIAEIKSIDWTHVKSFWDIDPSWQNAIYTVEKLKNNCVTYGLFHDNLLLGYIIYNKTTRRIHQLAVNKSYRNKGIGKQLMAYIMTNFSEEISITNIDAENKSIQVFMNQIKLDLFVEQLEMKLLLK